MTIKTIDTQNVTPKMLDAIRFVWNRDSNEAVRQCLEAAPTIDQTTRDLIDASHDDGYLLGLKAGYSFGKSNTDGGEIAYNNAVTAREHQNKLHYKEKCADLQRSALTDQEILEAWPINNSEIPHAFDLLWFARFLERKIKGGGK